MDVLLNSVKNIFLVQKVKLVECRSNVYTHYRTDTTKVYRLYKAGVSHRYSTNSYICLCITLS